MKLSVLLILGLLLGCSTVSEGGVDKLFSVTNLVTNRIGSDMRISLQVYGEDGSEIGSVSVGSDAAQGEGWIKVNPSWDHVYLSVELTQPLLRDRIYQEVTHCKTKTKFEITDRLTFFDTGLAIDMEISEDQWCFEASAGIAAWSCKSWTEFVDDGDQSSCGESLSVPCIAFAAPGFLVVLVGLRLLARKR